MGGEHSLDLAVFVLLENVGVFLDRHAFAPIDLEGLYIQLLLLAEIDEEVTENDRSPRPAPRRRETGYW